MHTISNSVRYKKKKNQKKKPDFQVSNGLKAFKRNLTKNKNDWFFLWKKCILLSFLNMASLVSALIGDNPKLMTSALICLLFAIKQSSGI